MLFRSKYRVTLRNLPRIFEVLECRGGVEIAFVDNDDGQESFDPRLVLDGNAWRTLRPMSNSEAQNPSGSMLDGPALARPRLR